ncbi:hypothetical protein GNI_116340 [Gregarina niphandrodes]|uniref:Splicing factor YJU2 n=1 Tax=Gregarina niphandrodes TaxID=110365 RepID=A0A023B2X8_GRENI|nr:hypothetical protein GNI_116340 [Gregarina niphandrodes]EZG55194.1 hypothetical protein GNI_116340 [Gregarina niphandrodes]|eukprot:XP_011131721.1 hypothetical protein GNI_116340 [Gregarina niphandrodes]
MSDVKDMNKYYPPDFDPESYHRHKHILKQVGRGRKKSRTGGPSRRGAMELRMLWPFSLVCERCEEVTFVGTKFNSRVERLKTEDYLGIPIWRISGKCHECHAPIVLKTDPKNTDYVIESGGHRLFDAALAAKEIQEEKDRAQHDQQQLGTMEQLERKAINTAQEIQDLESIARLQAINKAFLLSADLVTDQLLETQRVDEDIQKTIRTLRRERELREEELASDIEPPSHIEPASELAFHLPSDHQHPGSNPGDGSNKQHAGNVLGIRVNILHPTTHRKSAPTSLLANYSSEDDDDDDDDDH